MRVATETMSVLLGPEGPMADHLPGFNPRNQQREMATLIADCLDNRDVALCEAGTGTGKTLAYLIPTLSAELKTIVSTATKTLDGWS